MGDAGKRHRPGYRLVVLVQPVIKLVRAAFLLRQGGVTVLGSGGANGAEAFEASVAIVGCTSRAYGFTTLVLRPPRILPRLLRVMLFVAHCRPPSIVKMFVAAAAVLILFPE